MKNIIYTIAALLFTMVVKAQTYYTEPITSTTPYLGQTASATLEILLRSPSLQIENPLIVVEGFDSGLLGVENTFGENDIRDFLEEVDFSSINLENEINTYYIIYVNWVNGNDYLQRNAALLKDIIEWVNTNKTGNTPNVVLGQSMGGVVARYALRDMELNSNENHDTSLYISHDAPHQGAHVPLGLLYLARHTVDQFIQTPLGGYNIPVNKTGNVSLNSIEDLLDAPAVKQMLKNNVNANLQLDNSMHTSWQNEL